MAGDTNTRGHRQWFYFSLTSPATQTLTLIVHSFRKRMSLFQIGMRPYGKRREEAEEAWRAVGRNVKYLRSDRIVRNQRTVDYTLSFEIELQKEEEFCIASCVPYTYSFLKESLHMLKHPAVQRVDIRQQTLCRTLTGLEVPLITINGQAANRPHRYLIINARTHPGESSASWVADGILREVAASGVLQGLLLEFGVVVKIVPMLNV
jgi:murein tripeptide amidase MpaA